MQKAYLNFYQNYEIYNVVIKNLLQFLVNTTKAEQGSGAEGVLQLFFLPVPEK